MSELKHVERRTNLMFLWGGLACVFISIAGALAIWTYPFAGPDLRTEFCVVLVPGGGLGVVVFVLGFCGLRVAKKRNW
ncbi:hypothetical protein [Pseudomonas sp. NPDC089569]|uniref:hypothetical protein n=1 Tax=Pseudomonas sp. NPDC089569 TaxID=3390722 RepID=UPI003D0022CD